MFALAGFAVLAACGGGGGGSSPAPQVAASSAAAATATASASATNSPVAIASATSSPPASPSAAPSSAPTASAAATRAVGFITYANTQSNPASYGIPTLLGAYGDITLGGSDTVWEYTIATQLPLADGAPATRTSNAAVVTAGPVAAATTAGFVDAYTVAFNSTGLGQATLNVAFASASAALPIDVYHGWYLRCDLPANPTVAYIYQNGVLTATGTAAGADLTIDCTNPQGPVLTFPHGALLYTYFGSPYFGDLGSTFTSFTVASQPAPAGTFENFIQDVTQGTIYGINTAEGRVAKIEIMSTLQSTKSGIYGIDMEASAAGQFSY